MKKYAVEFSHQPSRYYTRMVVETVYFTAEHLLDLYKQIDMWRGDGDYAPVYMDEIYSIHEVKKGEL